MKLELTRVTEPEHLGKRIHSSFVQLQKNIRNNQVGQAEMDGDIDFFVVDSSNLNRYQQGKSFTCFYAQKNGSISGLWTRLTERKNLYPEMENSR